MRQHSIIKVAIGVLALLAASCSPDGAILEFQTDGKEQTYTLYLDADAPNFDTVHEGETRASGNNWEDGDEIYIAFSNGGNTKVSNATYMSSIGAFQFTAVSLSTIVEASCSVYYFRGGTFSVSDNIVALDKYTAIFTDTNAIYTCSNNTIILKAAFKPFTWRLCFKGSSGTQVKLKSASTIIYNSSLNLANGSFSTKAEDVSMQIQNDGYTPFIYGLFTDSNNMLMVKMGGSYYSRKVASSKLVIGESGYFTIPTTTDLNGWDKTAPVPELVDGYECIDLGLRSGTLWATCNIGASSPEEYGGHYAWGETEEKDNYTWSSYLHRGNSSSTYQYIGDDIAGTGYDVAHVKLGGSWRMPSYAQFEELIENSTVRWTWNYNGANGLLVTGPNGSQLFLPAAGWCSYSNLSAEEEGGYYWTSSLMSRQYGSVYRLDFSNSNGLYCKFVGGTSYEGCSVRAVCPGEPQWNSDSPIADAIDLGLPSGTKWASWNVGATCPEDYGGYYAWGETEEKGYYNWITYNYCDGSENSCYFIGEDIAGTKYDVAHAKWGGSWQMPSEVQFSELKEYCSFNWTSQNGVNGILVTGPNGNSIFFPAGGDFWGASIQSLANVGYYWSSQFIGREECAASCALSKGGSYSTGNFSRCAGLSVRAVWPKEPSIIPDCPVAEAIDLGLPSGTKWASWNVGASAPEEYGGYYAWGETEEKDDYSKDTYKYYDNGFVHIGDDIAGTEYDVAHVKWGGSWRMPTKEQQDELIDNCTIEITQLNGVNGLLVFGPNGNSIFLPAGGERWGSDLKYIGRDGSYWLSTLLQGYEDGAYFLGITSPDGWSTFSIDYRENGLSVRAVIPPKKPQADFSCPDDHHPHMIDLGLSSGTK